MIASAVDSRKTGFVALARRRNTELRLPAISRDNSSPSNRKVLRLFFRKRRRTPDDRSSEWTMLASRSAPCSPLRQEIRCRHGRSSSIAGGDEAPPCRAAKEKKRRSQNAEDRQSSSTRERRGLSWLSWLSFTNLQSHSESYRHDDHGPSPPAFSNSVAVLQELKNSATSKH